MAPDPEGGRRSTGPDASAESDLYLHQLSPDGRTYIFRCESDGDRYDFCCFAMLLIDFADNF
jgi:hypothetical protein